MADEELEGGGGEIAVVGMAARLPGAPDVDTFWRNLETGTESVRRYTDAELLAAGVSPALLRNPHYVKAGAHLGDMELFDAGFFGFSPREAAILDPQHRHFLEVCWEALEHAGHVPERFDGAIGVFGGSGHNAYMPYNLFTHPELMEQVGLFLVRHTGNDKDFLTTRVSYCLNLTGPSVNVQTACSTSLVAIHLACQSLIAGESDLALAGGVTIEMPHHRGYLYEEGEILSPDGHCRSFDHRSKGTIFGSGAGVVVLRRLEDALDDGDTVYALVRATAINNDGARKVGYLAPSVDGQAEAIVEALNVGDVDAADISYVECHGTGTPVGDPIEITALTQAYRTMTDESGYCAVGSVKSNIGHLDTAAGVASFIKVVQQLRHKKIAPTLHFSAPNPACSFDSSPFFVNAELRDWEPVNDVRIAGVQSLGVGGTNAHVLVEEAPEQEATTQERPWQLLPLSGRTESALDGNTQRLVAWLKEHPEANLADVGWTLLDGRRRFKHRRVVAAQTAADAIAALESSDPARVFTAKSDADSAKVAFLFPGGGAQYANMAKDIYESETVFSAKVDECLELLKKHEDLDLRPLMFPPAGEEEKATLELQRASLALPALLTIELAYAALWESWGVTPSSLIGHSMGEYAAAHLCGVMSLKDALGIVCCRGRLFESLPEGGMLSVNLSEDELKKRMPAGLDVAVINGPEMCVASGPPALLDELQAALEKDEIDARRVKIHVAAHSSMLEPILAPFRAYLEKLDLRAPELPWVSNLTGAPITADDAKSPTYWVNHLRQTVRFADGLAEVLKDEGTVLLEVGPGQTLTSLARAHPAKKPAQQVVPSSRHPREEVSDHGYLVASAGRLWMGGFDLAGAQLFEGEARRRIPLPTYAFDHERHWIEPGNQHFLTVERKDGPLVKTPNLDAWFYTPSFRAEPPPSGEGEPSRAEQVWLLFEDGEGVALELASELRAQGAVCVTARFGDEQIRGADERFVIREGEQQDIDDLLQDLVSQGRVPHRIVYLAGRAKAGSVAPTAAEVFDTLPRGFHTLLYLGQVLGNEDLGHPVELCVVTRGAFAVTDEERVRHPEQRLALGPVLVIPQEVPEVRARLVDLEGDKPREDARRLLEELAGPSDEPVVVWRGKERFVQTWGPHPLGSPDEQEEPPPAVLDEGAVVVITGGLGGLGLTFAEHLARTRKAKLALLGRSGLPERAEWGRYIETHDERDPIRRRMEAVQLLEDEGSEVLVLSADITRPDELKAALDVVRGRFGPIQAALHTAGVLDDDPLALKDAERCARVLAPKVRGGLALVEALAQDPLQLLVLFSSTSAVLGPPGQIDYVAANAFLNGLAAHVARERPEVRTLATGWGVWSEVGMAVAAALPRAPVAVGEPIGHPFLQRQRSASDDEVVFSAVYDTAQLWVLDEHRVRATGPVLPGTAYLEVARAALERGRPGPGKVELKDLFFVAPLEVQEGSPREVRVTLRKEPGDEHLFVLESRASEDDEEGWLEHARGTAARTERAAPPDLPVEDVASRCSARDTVFEEGQQALPQDQHLAFGPRWKVLREMRFGHGEALARLELPASFAGDLDEVALHPGLFDMLSGFAFSMLGGEQGAGRLYVPLSYQRLTVHGAVPRQVVSWVKIRDDDAKDGIATLDVTVADPGGKVVIEIAGYVVKAVDPATFRATRPGASTGAPSLLEQWLTEGILPAEGTEALERAIRAPGLGQVVISSLDLYALLEATRPKEPEPVAATAPAPAGEEGGASGRAGPRDDVERKLVELWRQLLGVSDVGIRDNFFDLGGHSLIAVRLFARIKKAYGVDLSIAVLFEAPTIEGCAEIIRDELGITLQLDEAAPAAADGGGETAPPARKGREWSPLVTIQKGSGRPPFFCVHGAGGNVLNFRDLSSHLGSEQPFYGLQAAGVDGKRPPSETIEEMADLYLPAILEQQPKGPYFFGGYSGGGVVAYEMAQRLVAKGEKVALVAFLDTFRPGIEARRPTLQDRMLKIREEGMALYLSRKAKARLSYHLEELSAELKMRYFISRGMPLPIELRDSQLTRGFYEAAERYHPKPYHGAVTLFRAREIADIYAHVGPALGWEELVPQLVIHEVPGDHDSLVLEPNVQLLTAHLRDELQKARERVGM